jgi:hypothetical protein
MAVMTIVQARCRAAPRAAPRLLQQTSAPGARGLCLLRAGARAREPLCVPLRAVTAQLALAPPATTASSPASPRPARSRPFPASPPPLPPLPCRPLPTHASASIRRRLVAPVVAEEGQRRSGSAPQHAVRLSREHAVGQPASRPLRPPPKPSSARGAAGAAGGAAEYEAILRAVRGGAGDAAVDRELAQVPPPPPRGSRRVGAVQSVAACRVCRIVRGVRVLLEGSLACFVAVGI